MQKKEGKILIILIIILIVADQILKLTILYTGFKAENKDGLSIEVLNTEKTENNFSYILIAIIAIGVLVRYINSKNSFIHTDSKIVLCFAIAGVLSNTIDRLWKGFVINYINIPNFAPLNLAYVYIIITWISMAVILTKFTKNNRLYTREKITEQKTNETKKE